MSNMKKSRVGRPSRFPPEFRRDAVAMVIDDKRPIADVARATGVNSGTLGNWVGQERIERGERAGLTVDDRSELVELRAGGLLGLVSFADSEATMKACGVAGAMLQGHSWAPTPSNGSRVNVGTISAVPSPASSLLVSGKTRRQLMLPGWGGGPVAVRGRESRSHGEGVQRVRGMKADPGRRFDDVFNLVYDPAFLVVAWRRVRGNKGARTDGIDGVAPRSIVFGAGSLLDGLREDLKAGRFRPQRTREKAISKAGGTVRRPVPRY